MYCVTLIDKNSHKYVKSMQLMPYEKFLKKYASVDNTIYVKKSNFASSTAYCTFMQYWDKFYLGSDGQLVLDENLI